MARVLRTSIVFLTLVIFISLVSSNYVNRSHLILEGAGGKGGGRPMPKAKAKPNPTNKQMLDKHPARAIKRHD